MSDVLRLENVSRRFKEGAGQLEIFADISLSLKPGEIVALVGQSGAGKSSLLHIAGLLEAPSSGEIMIAGAAVSNLGDAERTRIRRDTIGFVYQAHHLLPEFDALENVMMPQMIAGVSRKDAGVEAARILNLMGLGQRLTHRPAQLSGGEQQRVAIARAIISRPEILILDEPTASLDGDTGRNIVKFVREHILSDQRCIVIVTHDSRIYEYADRIVRMEDGKMSGIGRESLDAQ
jgi:lipoprotein-releasing system ATP-binding protein